MWLFKRFKAGVQQCVGRVRGESRGHYRQRRRAASRRTFTQSLFCLNAPLDFIVPWRRAMRLECLESRVLLTGPTANSDSYADDYNATLNIPAYAGVLANDTGGNGPLSAVLVSGPNAGNLTLNADGSFAYTNTSYPMMGTDSFSYEAFDGASYSAAATATLTFGNNQPQANGGIFSVVHGHTLSVSAADGVLKGATDPNHLHLTAVLESGPSHGSLTLNSGGSFSYTPLSTFAGTDYFSFEAYDGNFYSTSQQVEIDVSETPPTAGNPMYSLLNNQTLNVSAADGVVAASSGDSPLTASLYSGPTHGSLSLNSDGSFSYTPDATWVGTDRFQFTVSDGISTSNGTVTLTTDYGVVSAVDQTKLPVDTIHVARQILSDPFNSPITSPLPAGGSGGTSISAAPADGAPATAHNLALVYDSVLAQPDQVIEAEIGFSTDYPVSDTLTAALTFNGVSQPSAYFNMNSMGGNGQVHIAMQVDTSGLASGRYPYSITVSGQSAAAPVTISGAVNVVNDSASPFGKGWDMPGLYRLFQNNVPGVPAGLLLSTGDAGAWYYSQNQDGSFASPAGPLAFSTLTAVAGGGWQLVTHQGITFNFNSSGYLTSRVERTGETTLYNWTDHELTSIVDQFGRVVPLTYSGGLLASIGDFAGSTWVVAHSGTNLVSISEPDPGGGSPVWQYAYSGNYMSSVTDPNLNQESFTLSSAHRLSGTALPGGASTADTSEQDFGYGSTDPNNPASLTMQVSVVPTTTDADGNTSAVQTNQFGQPVSEVDAYGSLTTIQRDDNGMPTVITQPPPATGEPAPVTTISYDTSGDEASATGAMPSYGTWTFNTFGEWDTFTDSLGKEWKRSFDTKGNVLTETDPLQNQVSWTYDTFGQPLTMTLPAPNGGTGTVTTQYFYDADERLQEILWPDGSTQLFAHNADDRQTSFTDENSHTSVTTLDVLGRPTLVTDALQNSVATTYDKDSNVLTTRNKLGQLTTNEWNSRNELIQQTLPDPDGAGPLAAPVLTFTYTAGGQELTESDGLGRITTLGYDKLERRTSETLPDPDGAGPLASPVIHIGYDNLSRQVSEQNALGGITYTDYGNADERLVTSVTAPDPDGSGPLAAPVTQTGYDGDGRAVTSTNAMNQTETTTLNADGVATDVTDNLNHTTHYVVGRLGERLSTTDALSHTTAEQYDVRYRPVQTTAADGGITKITLDPAGNRVKLLDAAGNETDWTYSPTNLPLTETNALGTTATSYDAAAEITSIVDADGRERDFVHDGLGRLTTENWISGGSVVAAMNYAHDAANELTSASDGNSAYAFTYNGDGQVTRVDNAGTPGVPDVLLTSTLDAAGERTSLAATINGTADFLNNYSYDADQRLTMVQQQQQTGGNTVSPKEVDLAYNALGQFTSMVDYNFIGVGPRLDVATGDYSYDNGARLTGLAYTSNGGADTIGTFGWGYNAGNLVTSFTSIDGEADYGYDPTNQLVSATYTTASGGHQLPDENESYDLNGNRTGTGYSTGSNNLLTSDGTFNYQHDADGNTTVRTRISADYAADYRTTFAWDYRNRLTDVEYFDNNGVLTKHVHYVYGVFDHLIATEVDTTGSGTYNEIEHYVLDVQPEAPRAGVPGTALAQPLLKLDGNQDLTTRYLEALDRIFAEGAVTSPTQADTVLFNLVDNLGTLRDQVNASGMPVNHLVYAAFGQEVYASDRTVAHWTGFGGGHLDTATGNLNNDHRWYDPVSQRWLSLAPEQFSAHDPNLDRYSGNSPTNLADPSGLAPNGTPPGQAPPGQKWVWSEESRLVPGPWQTGVDVYQVPIMKASRLPSLTRSAGTWEPRRFWYRRAFTKPRVEPISTGET